MSFFTLIPLYPIAEPKKPVRKFKFHPMPRYESVSGLGSLCRNIYQYVPKVHKQVWFQNICLGKADSKKKNSLF